MLMPVGFSRINGPHYLHTIVLIVHRPGIGRSIVDDDRIEFCFEITIPDIEVVFILNILCIPRELNTSGINRGLQVGDVIVVIFEVALTCHSHAMDVGSRCIKDFGAVLSLRTISPNTGARNAISIQTWFVDEVIIIGGGIRREGSDEQMSIRSSHRDNMRCRISACVPN